jgi:hypothetical protein
MMYQLIIRGDTVQKTKFHRTLTAKITDRQRTAIENMAEVGDLSIGEAARVLLDAGMKAKGLA